MPFAIFSRFVDWTTNGNISQYRRFRLVFFFFTFMSRSDWRTGCSCCCWSFLYSAILRSRADSLRSHVILLEWLAFYSTFLTIHRTGVLAALAWLVPQETAAISARSVYTIQPCTMSLHAKPYTYGVCVFSCNLPPALLAEWPGSFACYCGNTGLERIPK